MCNKLDRLNLKPFGATPSYRQANHLKKFNKKAFFHFGVNTFTNLEWGEGEERESVFNPSQTDVRQWIKTIKAAGFSLAILTAKHHDGFCLWPSKYTEHSLKNSPYKNGTGDIVKEFTDACHEFGLAVGIYLSPWDRNAPFWGTNEYSKYYNAQLTELMSNYGKIDEVWWDGAGSKETPYDWGLWAHTVRNLQPDAVIFGSMGATPYVECRWVGNESGYAGNVHYSTIDASSLEVEIVQELNTGKFGGERFIPAEVDVSIRPGWFYHQDQDDEVKSVEKLVKIWFDSIGRGCMMLLNFPPDRRGLVHETDAKNAVEAHNFIQKTFSVNLAAMGKANADSVRALECEADMMLNDEYECFYAASDDNITPVIEINLPEAVEFDCYSIGEYVELGQRICGYKVEAFVGGEWKLLADKKSMGYKNVEYFEAVTSDKVRISIYDAGAAPVIREFGLYKLPYDIFNSELKEKKTLKEAKDLTKGPSSKIIYENDGAIVEFGGIYPFNTIKFNGNMIWKYEVFAFDGSKFYSIHKGSKPAEVEVVHLPETIDSSYKIKIVTGRTGDESLDIGVFEI